MAKFISLILIFLCPFGELGAVSREALAIEEFFTRSTASYNQLQDPTTSAQFWSEDALYCGLNSNDHIQGREALIHYFQENYPPKSSKSQMNIILVNVAVESTEEAQVQGFAILNPSYFSFFEADLIQVEGKWLFKKVVEYWIGEAPKDAEKLSYFDYFAPTCP